MGSFNLILFKPKQKTIIMSVFVALHLKVKDGHQEQLVAGMKNVIPKMMARDGCVGVKPLIARDKSAALIMAEFSDAAKFDATIAGAKDSGKFEEMKAKLAEHAEVKVQTYTLGQA